jgi:hypothetical protein
VTVSGIDLLVDAFERIRDAVYPAVTGLSAPELAYRPDDESNSIAWLIWHLTRIQDDHMAGLHKGAQVWEEGGWAERYGLPFDPSDTGYGHGPDQVAEVVVDADALLGYYESVHQRTVAFLGSLGEDDLGRVVDRRWDPHVTMSVRLMSVVADDLQHVGQAAYVRGLLLRR